MKPRPTIDVENKVQVLTAGLPSGDARSGVGQEPKKKKAPADLASDTAPQEKQQTATSNENAKQQQQPSPNDGGFPCLELEESDDGDGDDDVRLDSKLKLPKRYELGGREPYSDISPSGKSRKGANRRLSASVANLLEPPPLAEPPSNTNRTELVWLLVCFFGIMASFVCYGLLLEYTTSGGRKLHEMSFLFVTSGLYTLTAAAGRHVRDETPTTIPPARFAVLGLTSMGSTFCSVRSLRYVIYPIQVLAKSCKPVPVMIMGAFMGKKYPSRKYFNVFLIVMGVGLFMGGGDKNKSKGGGADEDKQGASQVIGIILLFISLCFDGGTGAYEDKLMSVHSVQPFDLMYNIQLGKTILAGISLVVLNQMGHFVEMVREMGFLLVALGITGAMGQVFIFVTIAKFGALTCSIIGLARKVTTLVASIYFYGHHLNGVQFTGLAISVGAMVMNFFGKKGGGGHGHGPPPPIENTEETEKMLGGHRSGEEKTKDVEMPPYK